MRLRGLAEPKGLGFRALGARAPGFGGVFLAKAGTYPLTQNSEERMIRTETPNP